MLYAKGCSTVQCFSMLKCRLSVTSDLPDRPYFQGCAGLAVIIVTLQHQVHRFEFLPFLTGVSYICSL